MRAALCLHRCREPGWRNRRRMIGLKQPRCAQSLAHDLRRKRWLPKAHARRIKNRIGNGGCSRHGGRFTDAERGFKRTRHVQHFNDWHLAKRENRVAPPFAALHRCGRDLDGFFKCAAGRLQHIAMHLMLHPSRIHHKPRVMTDDDAFNVDFAGPLIHLNISHPRRPRCAVTGPLAVDIARVSKALTADYLRIFFRGGCCGTRTPPSTISGGLNQLSRPRIV